MALGVDFTGPTILAAVVEGSWLRDSQCLKVTSDGTPAQILDELAAALRELAPEVDRVGIAIPGKVDASGVCRGLPNLPAFEGIAIAEELGDRLRCEVAVENRATAAALAERLFGHGLLYPSFILVMLGTGVGAGLVIGRQLYPGTNGFAAEIGHLRFDGRADAAPCGRGHRGCIESILAIPAILRSFAELGGRGASLAKLAISARRGEPSAHYAVLAAGEALGFGLASVQNLLDLNAIVLSGPLAAAFDLLEPSVRRELRARSFSRLAAEVPILVSSLGENGAVIGASCLTQL